MKKWSACCRAGYESLVDDPTPGQANTVITVDFIDKMNDLVRSNCHVTLRMLAKNKNVSVGRVWTIIHESLRYRKVSSHLVPKRLTDQNKKLSVGIALQRLFRYHEDFHFPEHQ